MATKIEQYNAAKREQQECLTWASLIGDKYHGGGGGIGELRSLKLAKGEESPTVYHQFSDGDTNYHKMPASLSPFLEDAIKASFGVLLADALKRQELSLKDAAAEAVKAHGELLRAAGLCA
jgi:hypothetical protein